MFSPFENSEITCLTQSCSSSQKCYCMCRDCWTKMVPLLVNFTPCICSTFRCVWNVVQRTFWGAFVPFADTHVNNVSRGIVVQAGQSSAGGGMLLCSAIAAIGTGVLYAHACCSLPCAHAFVPCSCSCTCTCSVQCAHKDTVSVPAPGDRARRPGPRWPRGQGRAEPDRRFDKKNIRNRKSAGKDVRSPVFFFTLYNILMATELGSY